MNKLVRWLVVGAVPAAFAAATWVVPLNHQDWQGLCTGGTSCPGSMFSNDSNGNFTFQFPVYNDPVPCNSDNCPSVNYVYTPSGNGWPQRPAKSVAEYSTLSMTMAVKALSGSPQFFYQTDTNNTCAYTAHVRLFMWQWLDASTGGDRWWSNPIAYELAPGTTTLTVQLSPTEWSNVNGQFGTADPRGFSDALNHLHYVGMTFGGGCFYGHGVSVNGGTAEFVLSNVTFQ